MVKSTSSSERKILVDKYLTELSLLAKRLCPEAKIEATTEAFEDEDGHIRIYPPAGRSEKETADIEGKVAGRCVDIFNRARRFYLLRSLRLIGEHPRCFPAMSDGGLLAVPLKR